MHKAHQNSPCRASVTSLRHTVLVSDRVLLPWLELHVDETVNMSALLAPWLRTALGDRHVPRCRACPWCLPFWSRACGAGPPQCSRSSSRALLRRGARALVRPGGRPVPHSGVSRSRPWVPPWHVCRRFPGCRPCRPLPPVPVGPSWPAVVKCLLSAFCPFKSWVLCAFIVECSTLYIFRCSSFARYIGCK